MLSIYIHIPFCAKKCDYCDFASFAGKEKLIGAYFDALESELDGVIDKFGDRFETAFIGGGTPSFADSALIKRIASKIHAGEFTIEANPGTLTAGKLSDYLESGINRLSLGAQSFDDALLKEIGRIHSSKQAIDAANMAKEAGFDDINVDLMYALPHQTMEAWLSTLETAVSLPVTHISAYSLIIEEGTPIADRFSGLDDDTVNAMQRAANRILSENGFERYEISNYARDGHICRHNMRYWTREEYIGIGSAAHSFVGGRRFSNPSSIEEYVSGARCQNEEIISPEEAREESIMLGLRTVQGIEIASSALDAGKIRRLVDSSLAHVSDGRLTLTERGMEVMNAIVLELI